MEFQLANLPGDVLDHLLGNERSSYAILRLWKCGDSILNSKLRQSITYVKLSHDDRWPGKYPRLLSQFRKLRYLSISADSPLMKGCAHLWKEELAKLSTSLEHLEIGSYDSGLAIMNCAYHASLDGTQTLSYTLIDYPLGPSRLIDLGKLFPRLQTLILGMRHSSTESPGISDLAGLPSTLTHLRWPPLRASFQTGSILALLPRSLVRLEPLLEFLPHAQPNKHCHSPPPMLESINRVVWSCNETLEALPRSLKRCNVEIAGTQRKLLESLPPHIDELTIRQFPGPPSLDAEHWCAYLPQSLTKLIINTSSLYPELELLPRTLTQLSCHFSPTWFLGAVAHLERQKGVEVRELGAFWPLNLHTLNCYLTAVEIGHLALLPRTLTDLQIEMEIHSVDATFSASELPTSLTLLSVAYQGTQPLNQVGRFPHNLKALSSRSVTPSVGVHHDLLEMLPSSLTDLLVTFQSPDPTIDSPNFSWNFPSRLTSLAIYECPATVFSQLPPLLTLLNIHILHNDARDLNIFTALPSTLESIDIAEIQPESLVYADNSFANLPHLTSLDIRGVKAFRSKILRGISRRLTSLSVEDPEFTVDDAPFIPPLLRYFALPADYVLHPDLEAYWPIGSSYVPEAIEATVKARRIEKLFH